MFGPLIQGGTQSDCSQQDLGLVSDNILEVAPRIEGAAFEAKDASCDLAGPPFVNPPFLLEAILSYGRPQGAPRAETQLALAEHSSALCRRARKPLPAPKLGVSWGLPCSCAAL